MGGSPSLCGFSGSNGPKIGDSGRKWAIPPGELPYGDCLPSFSVCLLVLWPGERRMFWYANVTLHGNSLNAAVGIYSAEGHDYFCLVCAFKTMSSLEGTLYVWTNFYNSMELRDRAEG